MRKVSFVVVAVFCCALPCLAKIGTIDRVPASTLLFPYFEVDPTNPNGVTTVLGIQNASATAMLLNVTLWTDYGIPTAHFMIYLTGYDVQTIDLYDFFVNGQAPVTASDGQDPTDTISPQGNFSQDINFASCNGVLPPGQVFGPELLAAHSGGPSVEYFGGNCGSKNYGDGRLRGYITVDTTNSCTIMTPASAGYSSVLTFQNVLVGDYSIIDRANARMSTDTAVQIEARFPSDPPVTQTFYGRFNGGTGVDQREPLPTDWGGTYMTGRTTMLVWRDPGQTVAPFPCGGAPPFSLGQQQLVAYDSQENPTAVAAGNYFPLATGSTPAGPGGVPTIAKWGWIFLNLGTTANPANQSWVVFSHLPEAQPATTPFGTGRSGVIFR